MRPWAAIALAACYAPSAQSGAPCGPDQTCPSPLVCAPSTMTCERSAGGDAAVARDVLPDTPGDSDADGVLDISDNCPQRANGDQRDEDADDVGNVCDNCPPISNPTQADTTEAAPDGVGDACDPRPGLADRIAFFEPFDEMPTGWDFTMNASVSGGKLRLPSYGHAYTAYVSTAGVVETQYTILAFEATTDTYRAVELIAERGPTGAGGYRCGMFDNPQMANSRYLSIEMFIPPYSIDGAFGLGTSLAIGESSHLQLAFGGTLACKSTMPPAMADDPEPEARTGALGMYTQHIDATYDYLILYEPAL